MIPFWLELETLPLLEWVPLFLTGLTAIWLPTFGISRW